MGQGINPDEVCQSLSLAAKYRYRVVRPIPSVSQIVAAISPLALMRLASAAWSALSLAGRPNLRPDLRACSNIKAVRSRTSSRSYSAMDIRIPATILPVLVEMCGPTPPRRR